MRSLHRRAATMTRPSEAARTLREELRRRGVDDFIVTSTPDARLGRLDRQYPILRVCDDIEAVIAPNLPDVLDETLDEAASTRFYALSMCGVDDPDVPTVGLSADLYTPWDEFTGSDEYTTGDDAA